MKGSVTGKVVEWSKGETMDQMEDTFSAWDYTIFALLLVISTGLSWNSLNIQLSFLTDDLTVRQVSNWSSSRYKAIGIFFGWRDRKNKDSNNYALGGQKFTALPVALSLTATSISAITMMGSPSEYYVYGSTFAWVALVDVLACLVAALVYIPIYYNLGVTSIYEYLEIRFGPSSRTIMTIGKIVYLHKKKKL